MKFIRPLMFLILTSAVGCANTQQMGKQIVDSSASQNNIQKLPNIELTSSIFYGILASEIAAQRGGAKIAAQTYLQLAKDIGDPRLAERATDFAINSNDKNLAQDTSKLWLSLDANSYDAKKQILLFRLSDGLMLLSKQQIEDLLKINPKEIFTLLVVTAANQKDKSASLIYVQELTNRYKTLPEAQFALLATASEDNQQKVVDACFDRLLKIAPKWDLPVLWRVENLRKHDNLTGSISFLKYELDRRPDADFAIQIIYPKLLLSANRNEEAKAAFITLIKRYPTNPDLLYPAGYLSYVDKDLVKANEYLTQAIRYGYKNIDLLYDILGHIAIEQNKLPEARSWFAKVGQGPMYASAQVELSLLDVQEKKFNEASKRLNDIPEKSAKNLEDLFLLQANVAYLSKNYDLSWSIASKGIKRFPKSTKLLYFRAILGEEIGHIRQALFDMYAYVKISPNSVEGLNALGYMLTIHTKHYAEARFYIEKALSIEPKNGAILDSMGWVIFKQGSTKKALPYLQQAWSVMQKPEIAAHLGEVLFTLGKKNDAIKIWKKGISLDANNKYLRKTIKRFGVSHL